ncbi:hypothetical protein JTE90_015470 [Oedothorax gibbosus]|uniref:Uncharacterized protein n=1 Tax=Oedothorax gibbosus TaxID=931172 RepID=A0AAV6UKY2_9ARAC|nr:hypothetical protein JTE90_015470 [Oedothorax gibbosus]
MTSGRIRLARTPISEKSPTRATPPIPSAIHPLSLLSSSVHRPRYHGYYANTDGPFNQTMPRIALLPDQLYGDGQTDQESGQSGSEEDDSDFRERYSREVRKIRDNIRAIRKIKSRSTCSSTLNERSRRGARRSVSCWQLEGLKGKFVYVVGIGVSWLYGGDDWKYFVVSCVQIVFMWTWIAHGSNVNI